jgi:fatty acid desaturase
VRDLTGQTFFKQRRAQLFGNLQKGQIVNPTTAHFLIFNALLLAGLSVAGYWWAYFALWIAPMATWLPLVTRLRNIAEHACVRAKEDPFTHARTTLANTFERLFIAPYWVHFHGEHHVFMHVPCYRLESLHNALMDKGYWSRMHIARGYASVLSEATNKQIAQPA